MTSHSNQGLFNLGDVAMGPLVRMVGYQADFLLQLDWFANELGGR
jgi:hypothetical protein